MRERYERNVRGVKYLTRNLGDRIKKIDNINIRDRKASSKLEETIF